MKTLTVSEARRLFARVLQSVVKDDAPVVICRYRNPVAAIVPVNRLSAAERTAAKAGPRTSSYRSR